MDFQSFGTDSALYTIMRNEKLSSTGIARLGLRDTERTATTGKKMRTLFYWIKEIMIMFLLTSMVLLTAAIGTAILLNNL